jgi:hypothetical protein
MHLHSNLIPAHKCHGDFEVRSGNCAGVGLERTRQLEWPFVHNLLYALPAGGGSTNFAYCLVFP